MASLQPVVSKSDSVVLQWSLVSLNDLPSIHRHSEVVTLVQEKRPAQTRSTIMILTVNNRIVALAGGRRPSDRII